VRPVILVHGGASAIAAARHEAVKRGCLAAARAGDRVLQSGGDALEAVVAAVTALEDDPEFNAGRGAALTREGTAELDAAVMRGRDRAVGAVTCVRRTRNPVRLARAVMDSEHVFLAGEGADRYGLERGLEGVRPDYFVTERQRAKLAAQRGASLGTGTVGAVALDAEGGFAAATSTGGRSGKRPGRVGDTPLVGAGTYASAQAAVSGTGEGEFFIRSLAAFLAAEAAPSLGAQGAAERGVAEVARLGGVGGLIVVEPGGELGVAFNTPHMARAWVRGGEASAAV